MLRVIDIDQASTMEIPRLIIILHAEVASLLDMLTMTGVSKQSGLSMASGIGRRIRRRLQKEACCSKAQKPGYANKIPK